MLQSGVVIVDPGSESESAEVQVGESRRRGTVRDRQYLLCALLPDDVLVEMLHELRKSRSARIVGRSECRRTHLARTRLPRSLHRVLLSPARTTCA